MNPLPPLDFWPPLRVRLVDDHAIVREGYRRLFEIEGNIRVVGEHPHVESVLRSLDRSHGADTDLIVLDLSMPGQSGLEVLRQIVSNWPHVSVLVFTMHDSPAMADQALRAGAAGFVTKNCEPSFLLQAVRRVAAGERGVLSPDVTPLRAGNAPPSLAPREFEVLQLLIEGRSLDDIGQRLSLSSKTVANYQTMIRQKLGVSSPIELLRYAQLHGLAAT
jgi:two-component system, NarL family, response regulator FusR